MSTCCFFLPSICCHPSLPFHLLTLTGNLYFANVKTRDHRGGKHYVCVVSNGVLRGLVQGDDQIIEPKQSTGNCGNRLGSTHGKYFILYILSSSLCMFLFMVNSVLFMCTQLPSVHFTQNSKLHV